MKDRKPDAQQYPDNGSVSVGFQKGADSILGSITGKQGSGSANRRRENAKMNKDGLLFDNRYNDRGENLS